MSFCHALETKCREYERNGDYDKLALLPIVSAFEKESSHGGLWREDKTSVLVNNEQDESATTTAAGSKPPMYEGMWCNSAKEGLEFFDYTFDEHFGCALPTYIQRGPILDYMSARVTRNSPHFFEKYVTFNTEVTYVTYDESNETFSATIKNVISGEEETSTYDKVVYAGGLHTKAFIPPILKPKLQPFKGTLIHSSEVGKVKDSVQGKRILVVGGSYSAEDITLTSIKLGAEKIYISSRSIGNNVVALTDVWPLDKVEHIKETVVHGVDDDNCILLISNEYENEEFVLDQEELITLCGIDVIVLCTGFDEIHYYDMFDTQITLEESIYEDWSEDIKLPSDWEMKNNFMDKVVGKNIELDPDYADNYLGIRNALYYHMIPRHNPNMIYLLPFPSVILWSEVMAYLALSFVTGEVPVPSSDGMKEWIQNRMSDEMQVPSLRYLYDANYREKVDSYEEEKADGTVEVSLTTAEEEQWFAETEEFAYKVLADMMEIANYPVDMGNFQQLNEVGRTYLTFEKYARHYSSSELDGSTNTSTIHSYKRSFRDLDESNLSYIRSIYSGTQAIPFNQPWLDINDFEDIKTLCDGYTNNGTQPSEKDTVHNTQILFDSSLAKSDIYGYYEEGLWSNQKP